MWFLKTEKVEVTSSDRNCMDEERFVTAKMPTGLRHRNLGDDDKYG